jgi:hypothetical protein
MQATPAQTGSSPVPVGSQPREVARAIERAAGATIQ